MPLPVLPIILKELGGKGRTLLFGGTDLPFDPGELELGGRIRSKVTYYPGSKIPTAQVLGPEEDKITFSGMFEDRRRGVLGHAIAQQVLIDQVRSDGRPMLFNYGIVTRRVLWGSATFKIHELTRIAYRIELQVIDHNLESRNRLTEKGRARKLPDLSAVLAPLNTIRVGVGLLSPALGAVGLGSAALAVERALTAVEAADAILSSLGRAGGILRESKASQALSDVDTGRVEIRASAAHLQQLDPTLAGTDFEQLGPRFELASLLGESFRAAGELAGVRPSIARLASQAQDALVYVAADGESLQRIAARFYGTAQRWPEILRANGKQAPEVVAGETLIIPDPVPQSLQVVA